MAVLEENPFDKLDRYDLRHYLEHLRDGGRSADVHLVLREESSRIVSQNGSLLKRIFAGKSAGNTIYFRNGWCAAQEKIGEISNFVKDVRLCWNVAEIESNKVFGGGSGPTSSSIGFEARYALINSCLNNLAGNIPPILLSRLVEERSLTVGQAFTYIEQIPDLLQRALATALVAFQAEKPARSELFEQAFGILRSLRSDIALAKILVKIAETVSEPDILPELIGLARGISYEKSRAEALLGLLPFLPEETRREVIEMASTAAREIHNELDRAKTLSDAALHLDEPQKSETLRLALQIISSFTGNAKEYSQSEALKHFIRATTDEMISPASAILETMSNAQYRAAVQLAFAARLFIQGNTQDALQVFNNFGNPLFDAQLAWALEQVVPFAPPALMPEILKITLKIASEFYIVNVLEKLAPLLPENLVAEASGAVRRMHMADSKIRANARLAKRKIDFSDYRLLNKTVETVLQTELPTAVREDVVEILAPYTAEPKLRHFFSAIQKISDINQQILTVLVFSDFLPTEKQLNILLEEIARAGAMNDEAQRGEVETEIVTRLAVINETGQAFSTAFQLRPFNWRAKALARLLANSPENSKPQIYGNNISGSPKIAG